MYFTKTDHRTRQVTSDFFSLHLKMCVCCQNDTMKNKMVIHSYIEVQIGTQLLTCWIAVERFDGLTKPQITSQGI